jgi:hypothetical protein
MIANVSNVRPANLHPAAVLVQYAIREKASAAGFGPGAAL